MGYDLYAINQIFVDDLVTEIRRKNKEVNHTLVINQIIADFRAKIKDKELTFVDMLKGE